MPEVKGRRRDSPRKDEPPSKRIRGSDSSRSPGSNSSSHRNGRPSSPRYSSRDSKKDSKDSRSSEGKGKSRLTDETTRQRKDSERSSRSHRRRNWFWKNIFLEKKSLGAEINIVQNCCSSENVFHLIYILYLGISPNL